MEGEQVRQCELALRTLHESLRLANTEKHDLALRCSRLQEQAILDRADLRTLRRNIADLKEELAMSQAQVARLCQLAQSQKASAKRVEQQWAAVVDQLEERSAERERRNAELNHWREEVTVSPRQIKLEYYLTVASEQQREPENNQRKQSNEDEDEGQSQFYTPIRSLTSGDEDTAERRRRILEEAARLQLILTKRLKSM